MNRSIYPPITLLLTAFSLVAHGAAEVDRKVSRPLEYKGWTQPAYESYEVYSAYVPMSDGVQLAIDCFVPNDGPEQAAFPVILEYEPYQRATVDLETGEVRDRAQRGDARMFLAHGYAVVQADMRGTGASSGWMMDFMPQLADDGKELVDWIARQPWCDGNVGMMGGSYLGWSQTATASKQPEALKCIMPSVIPLDGYTGEARPGGIYLESFVKGFSEWIKMLQSNVYLPDNGLRPAKPAADDDGDGEYADEVPVDANGNGSFLDDGFPPAYRDGAQRKHLYYNATRDHGDNYDYHSWAEPSPFIDSRLPLDLTMYDLSPAAHLPGVMKSGIPVYNLGGWFDAFTRGTFEIHCTLAETNPSKLLVVPAYHNLAAGPYWQFFGHDEKEAFDRLAQEHLRFFDRYLKGVQNGIDDEPPVCIYVMHGKGLRLENEWPLARQRMTPFYCDGDNMLRGERVGAGSDGYRADLSHSSSYTETQGNRWVGIGNQRPASPPLRNEQDAKSLVYTSAPLPDDMEVTGHPIVHLSVSCTSPDADFFVYLSDVDEDGKAWLVSEGQLRAGFAVLRDNDEMLMGGREGIDVLPDLPWHGFEKADYNGEVFAGGAVADLAIDLFPTSWVFRQGHRVRLSIACADYPTFPLHPAVSPANDPYAPDNAAPIVTLHRGGQHASRIELPVIPRTGE